MNSSKIKTIHARQLIDCNCRPMVEVDVITESGASGSGSAPTGKSVGAYESFVLRDNDPNEYKGLSVHKAVDNVNNIIAPALTGRDVTDQKTLDKIMIELDGTPDKHKLGGNAIYSTSIALLRAAAAVSGKPLYSYLAGGNVRTVPIPSFNMINGGLNGTVKQAFNEFIVMPWRAKDIYKAVEIAVLVFNKVGEVIRKHTGAEAAVGRSYGWVAPSEDPEEIFGILQEAIDACGFTEYCAFAIDCAASEMYDEKTRTYYLKGRQVTSDEVISYMAALVKKHKFVFVEDMLDENDWDGYARAHQAIHDTMIFADDFTVTNKERIQRACELNAIDGFILKPNQVGTISEAMDAYHYARERGLIATPSGRSGGVINDVVMDLAVGLHVPFIKNGCPRSGERIDKLNYLMRVADSHEGCVMSKIDHLVKFK